MSDNIIHISPEWMPELPTSTVVITRDRLKKSQNSLRNGNFVNVKRRTDTSVESAGVFQVDIRKQSYAGDAGPGSNLGMNPNIALMWGFDPDPKELVYEDIHLSVDLDASISGVPDCTYAKLCPYDFNSNKLVQFMREDNYLLHEGITEAVVNGSGTADIPFYVAEVEPAGWTVKVTESTEFEFINESEVSKYKKKRNTLSDSAKHTSDRAKEMDGTSSAGAQTEEDDIDFSVEFQRPKDENFDITFDKIAGLEDVKRRAKVVHGLSDDDVRETVKQHGEFFVPDEGNAVLLYGPPGCGKTMISKAIASEFDNNMEEKDVVFAEIEGSDILGRYQGVSETRLSKAFMQAKNAVSQGHFTILLFDEIESLVQSRSGDVKAHHQQLTATFLQEMNEVGRDVLIIAATNLPYELDSAAVRRFNTEIFVPHPGEEGLKDFWEMRLKDINTNDDLDSDPEKVEELAKASVDFAPSELDNRLLQSEIQSDLVLSAMRGEERPITKEYLIDKIDDLEPQVIDRYVGEIGDDYQQMEGYQELQEYVRERLMRNVDTDSDTSDSHKDEGDSDTGDSQDSNDTSDTQ